jgi:hypothetical protein
MSVPFMWLANRVAPNYPSIRNKETERERDRQTDKHTGHDASALKRR